MASLHYRTRIPNPMATLYQAENVHITWTGIPTPLFLRSTGIRVRTQVRQCN